MSAAVIWVSLVWALFLTGRTVLATIRVIRGLLCAISKWDPTQVTLRADSLLCSVVTGEASRILTLSSGRVDLQNVRRDLCRRPGQPVTTVA